MASKTVLVIDADSETEQLIASTLESEGYLVFAVPGGDIGAEMAQKVSPSLIFVNPEETGDKGLEICGTIHGYGPLKDVPIVVLTSYPGGMDPRSSSSFGIVDFLRVPFSAGELLEKTEKVLNAKSPVVLRIKEKDLHPINEEAPVLQNLPEEAEEDLAYPLDEDEVGKKGRTADISEIAGMDESKREPISGRKDFAEPAFPDIPEDDGPKKGRGRLLVALTALVIVIAGAAGFIFYSGLMPGMGPKTIVPKGQKTVQKPKAAVPPSPIEQEKQQVVSGNKAVPAPAPAQTPPSPAATAPSSPAAVQATAKPSSSAPSSSVPPPAASKAPSAVKPPPQPKAAGKTVHSVQLGVFKNEANAESLAKEFKGKGYDAFTLKSAAKDKGMVYRVLVGKSEDKKEAAKLAARIRGKEKIKAVIYSE